MRPEPFESPRLHVVRAQDLPLSGLALLELMRAVLARGVPFRFRALGWSMAPFIRDGDVITVAPLGQDRAAIGEVLAFVRPDVGSLVVHRVVARRGTAVVLQGDAVPEYPDGVIPSQNIVGRVKRIERNGRSVWLGLGPERYLIGWLSRAGLLVPLLTRLRSRLGPLLRRRRTSL